MDDVAFVEFEYCVPFKIVVAVSNEAELGLDDGAEVPAKTMLVLSEVKSLSVVIVSLTTVLDLIEVTSVFTITVPLETVLVWFVESRVVSSPDCCNQRQAE